MALLLTLPLQDMMVRARHLGYSVAGVSISFVNRIYCDRTPGGSQMNAGETYSSRQLDIPAMFSFKGTYSRTLR